MNEADFEVSQVSVRGISTELTQTGRGRPLLFLHGPAGVEAEREALALLGRNFRVYAPSHPGFGATELPGGFSTVDDLAYFYLDLLDQFDLSEAALVGASLGGWIAAEMAVKTTARLSHLVLVDAVGIKPASPDTIADVFGLTELQVIDRAFHSPAAYQPNYPHLGDDVLARVARNRESLALFTWSPYMHDPKLRQRLHRIDIPTLVLWGESDRIAPPAYGQGYADGIGRARFELVPQVGHHPLREQPAVAAGRIANFLLGR